LQVERMVPTDELDGNTCTQAYYRWRMVLPSGCQPEV
jgi:hypothetical protein